MQYKLGDKIKFFSEKQPYTITACNKRYIIATKPFNLKKTYMYTIIDLEENVRGPDNMIFGPGHEYDCKVDASIALNELVQGLLGISRYRIELDIERIDSE